MAEIILSTFLLALWVAAWLHWFFRGEIRNFLFAKIFPAGWRAGREPEDVLLLDTEDFEMFLASESGAPLFVRGVLGCPGCLSTYLSFAGLPLVFFALFPSLFALPLIWAAAAWIGHRLHKRI